MEKATGLSEEKKAKWRKVLVHSFISSEESWTEIGENDVPKSVLKVKGLSWRSPQVTKLFKKLDDKAVNAKSERAKRQTLPRIMGELSTCPKPVPEFGEQFWGYDK